jgi:hypothetical protein
MGKKKQDPNKGRCNATLVRLGNELEKAANFAGNISWKMEAGGLIVAGGAQLFGPEAEPIAAGGLAFASVGGVVGVGAGMLQTGGGVLQGLGGAGYSNATNGFVTTAGGLSLGALAKSAQSGNSVSQRLLNRTINNSATVSGGAYDTLVNALDALAPQEKSCN